MIKSTESYMTMEFVEGLTVEQMLAWLCNKKKRLSKVDIMKSITQVCSALEYAHNEHIIHRDIKPSNIIVDKDHIVKVVDFGIAKILASSSSQNLTASTKRLGTLPYMSPEQIDEKNKLDTRTDIFSLGIVLYELLTHEKPDGIREGKSAKPINSYRSDMPAKIDKILGKMLALDREQRYQCVEQIVDDLT